MDIRSILPLFMGRNNGVDPRTKTLLQLAEGETPDINTVLNMAKERSSPHGLAPLVDLAPYGIIGKLASFFARP